MPLSTSSVIAARMCVSGVAKTAGEDITSLAVSSSKLLSSCRRPGELVLGSCTHVLSAAWRAGDRAHLRQLGAAAALCAALRVGVYWLDAGSVSAPGGDSAAAPPAGEAGRRVWVCGARAPCRTRIWRQTQRHRSQAPSPPGRKHGSVSVATITKANL